MIGYHQQRVLDYLREHGPTLQVDLAQALGLSTRSLRAVIRKLLQEGAVLRVSTGRGRSSLVRLRGEP